MTDRNWEAELAKIDKQLSSVSDEQLVAERRAALTAPKAGALPGAAPAASPAGKGAPPSAGARTVGSWTSWAKVLVAVGGAAGLMLWPWPTNCGTPLLGYTAASFGVAALGVWSAFGTWRHRLGLAHLASLLVVVWGVALGVREVLPRVGYAIPTVERGPNWECMLPSVPTNPAAPAPGASNPTGTPSV